MDEIFYRPKENAQIRTLARRAIVGKLWQYWQMIIVIALAETLLSYIPQLIFGNPAESFLDLLTGAADDIPREVSFGSSVGSYVLQTVLSLLIIPLSYGVVRTTSLWARGIPTNKWQNLIEKYKGFKRFFKTIGLYILKSILIALWCILLVVPGIMKALSYSLSTYILYDEPELSIWQTLKKSEAIMKGYRGQLFLLICSFIGWLIVGAFTFGILYIWLVPYMLMSMAIFYDEVRRSYYNDDPALNIEANVPNFTPSSHADSPFADDDATSRTESHPFEDDEFEQDIGQNDKPFSG